MINSLLIYCGNFSLNNKTKTENLLFLARTISIQIEMDLILLLFCSDELESKVKMNRQFCCFFHLFVQIIILQLLSVLLLGGPGYIEHDTCWLDEWKTRLLTVIEAI